MERGKQAYRLKNSRFEKLTQKDIRDSRRTSSMSPTCSYSDPLTGYYSRNGAFPAVTVFPYVALQVGKPKHKH